MFPGARLIYGERTVGSHQTGCRRLIAAGRTRGRNQKQVQGSSGEPFGPAVPIVASALLCSGPGGNDYKNRPPRSTGEGGEAESVQAPVSTTIGRSSGASSLLGARGGGFRGRIVLRPDLFRSGKGSGNCPRAAFSTSQRGPGRTSVGAFGNRAPAVHREGGGSGGETPLLRSRGGGLGRGGGSQPPPQVPVEGNPRGQRVGRCC